jgi:hypothetical protein
MFVECMNVFVKKTWVNEDIFFLAESADIITIGQIDEYV